MSTVKVVGVALAALVALLGLTWLIQGSDFFMYKVFAPKYEAARRQVFESTRSFNQGMVQELQNMQFDYAKSKDPDARRAMASLILHRASGYNMDDPIVPADLRDFVESLKDEQTKGR